MIPLFIFCEDAMEIKIDKLGIYNVDINYLKYLHDDVDNEVYYAPDKYDTKPFLGIIAGIGNYTYFIPFTSSKTRHLKWKNVAPDHYLIYEIVDKNTLSQRAVCKPYMDDNKVIHILAALDVKKMIPVPDGLFTRVDFSSIMDVTYRSLLEKEYRFCQRIQAGIIQRVSKMYSRQKETGKVFKYHCNFAKLEEACDTYNEATELCSSPCEPPSL